MSRLSFDLTPLGMNTTNGTMSPIDLISIGTKLPEPTPLTLTTDSPTLPTNFPEENEKLSVPGDLDPDLSLSDSSLKKYKSSNDTNSSQSNKNKRDKKKKRRKDKKDDSSDPSSSVNSDSSYDSDYRRKQHKKKRHR